MKHRVIPKTCCAPRSSRTWPPRATAPPTEACTNAHTKKELTRLMFSSTISDMDTFKLIVKHCLQCQRILTLNNSRDIERKNFCSRSCHYKHLQSFRTDLRAYLTLGRTKESRAKAGKTLAAQMKAGLIPKPPHPTAGMTKYLCKTCGARIAQGSKTLLCRGCWIRSKRLTFPCEFCGKEKSVVASQSPKSRHRFCSPSCHYQWTK